MSEFEKCPECNNPNLLNDNENGEIVCITCGLVLGKTDFAPPADRIPKTKPTNPIAYTTSSVGTETNSFQRTERNVAYDIEKVLQKLDLPNNMKHPAINYVQKLRHKMKKKNDQKIRLTRTELTIIAVWATIKHLNYPLSADEYLKKLQPLYKKQNLMKIEKRANQFIKNQNRIPNTNLITKHINKIATTLQTTHTIDNLYANKLCNYAIQIVKTNPGIITNRRATLVAASAILAADKLIAKRLQLNPLAEKANIGTSSLSKLAETCKQYAPPPPPETASIQFNNYLLKKVNPHC